MYRALFVLYGLEIVSGKQMCHIVHCEREDVWNINGFDWLAPAREVKGTLLVDN